MGSGYDITVTGTGTPFVNNGAAVTAKNFIYRYPTDATITAAGGTYNVAENLWIAGSGTGSGTTYQLNGNLLVSGGLHVYATSFGVSILDTMGHSITADSLQVSDSAFQVGFLYANDSIIDINGDVNFVNSVTTVVNLGNSDWSVYGDWTNYSNTFVAGSSTVTLDGVNQRISGSTSFYNLSKVETINDGIDSILIFDNAATQTINGTLTLTGLDADDRISLVSDAPGNQWGINLTAPAAHALSYIVVTDSDASGSDPGQLTINPANSFSGGNNSGWFGASAGDDSYNVDEGSITNLDLCANDSDIDDGLDLTSIAITSGPANGSIIVNADGTVDYTHDGSETVADSFSYTIKDNLGNVSNIATVTINVNPVNDAPTTTGIADVTVNEDTLVTFINLQTSFADAEDPDTALVYTITNNTDPGLFSSITIGGAGGLNMNYAANQNGTADITVRATDTGGKFVETTFTVTVNAVNDAPVVNATASDTGTEDTDVVYTHAQLLTLIGATDVDDANANLSIAITNVTNGTLVMSGGTGGAGTTYTFTPTADFAGNLTFDYQVSDDESPTPATSAVGTATVAIAAVNDAPVVNATASDTGTEDTDVVYTHAQLLTLIGATDVDDANANLSISITNVNNGTLVMSGGSGGAGTTFTFTPTADFVGNLTFDYQVSDDEAPTPATSAVGTATVAIAAVNDVPVASASTVSTSEDNAYSFGVGDFTYSDVEGDSLVSVTITNLNLAGGTLEHSGGTTVINGMTITAAQIASLVYTPAANVSGAPLATFDFSVNDADAGVTTAQMDIDVTPVNDTPVANSDIILAGKIQVKRPVRPVSWPMIAMPRGPPACMSMP